MDLHAGEHVIYEGHPSWRSILRVYFLGLIVVAAAAAVAYFASGSGLAVAVGVGAFVLLLLIGWLMRITTRYLITNRRLVIRRGILARHVEESRVDRVVDVTVHQSPLQRLLMIGAVDFDNASGQQGDLFRFQGIANPGRITEAINQVHEESRGQAGQRSDATV